MGVVVELACRDLVEILTGECRRRVVKPLWLFMPVVVDFLWFRALRHRRPPGIRVVASCRIDLTRAAPSRVATQSDGGE